MRSPAENGTERWMTIWVVVVVVASLGVLAVLVYELWTAPASQVPPARTPSEGTPR